MNIPTGEDCSNNNNNNSNERDTLKLIPSLNYFINKNTIEQIEEEKKELDLSEKIDSYLNKLEKYNQTNNNKVFRIMEQENNKIDDEQKNVRIMEQENNIVDDEPKNVRIMEQENNIVDDEPKNNVISGEEETNEHEFIKKKSVLRKSTRKHLIRQLTQDSEKAAESHDGSDRELEAEDDDDDIDETKKNTLANTRIYNNKFTHLFFFKSDCALGNLSKQMVKTFSNFEFEDVPVTQPNTTTDDDRQKSIDLDEDTKSISRPSRSRSRKPRPKSNRVIRIDISEVDVKFNDPKSTTSKIEYLDDYFKENSIGKFYAFKKTLNLSSLYLASNIAISMSSIESGSDSEDSRDIASIHFTNEEVSQIRRESVALINQSILSNKHFSNLVSTNENEIIESNNSPQLDSKSIRKKISAMKKAAFDKIRSRSSSASKKSRNKSENNNEHNNDEFDKIDLRDFDEEKKKELNDERLNSFLKSKITSSRRNAISSRIDKLYHGAELVTYMENLLREEYIQNFLL